MLAATFREYGGPEVLHAEELPDLSPGPDEVLIRVLACGVNHSDLDSRAGTSRWGFELPFVLGAEFAGVVAAAGADARGVSVGDPVTAHQQYACGRCVACARWREDLCPRFTVFGTDRWGGYAQLAVVPARTIIPLVSDEQCVTAAAAQTVVSTAWHMATVTAAVRPGETVLVPSAGGGVAGALVQCAKLCGARVIASVGTAAKRDGVADLGADEVFCYRDVPVADAVARFTDGRGVDVVLDTVGGPQIAEHLAALALDGRLATCGAHAGEHQPIDLVQVFQRGQRILGFRVAPPEQIELALQMALAGRIRVPIARTFGLEHAAEAHVALDGRDPVGKIVLVMQ
jgi:NADPH:quinone reductase-like Zn-dependent oxidoreductase